MWGLCPGPALGALFLQQVHQPRSFRNVSVFRFKVLKRGARFDERCPLIRARFLEGSAMNRLLKWRCPQGLEHFRLRHEQRGTLASCRPLAHQSVTEHAKPHSFPHDSITENAKTCMQPAPSHADILPFGSFHLNMAGKHRRLGRPVHPGRDAS